MWAIIPMFLTCSTGKSRSILLLTVPIGATFLLVAAFAISLLPPVMGECLVGLGHLVEVLLLLDRPARPIRCIQHLAGQSVRHGLFPTMPRERYNPANSQRAASPRLDFHWHLVGRTSNPA